MWTCLDGVRARIQDGLEELDGKQRRFAWSERLEMEDKKNRIDSFLSFHVSLVFIFLLFIFLRHYVKEPQSTLKVVLGTPAQP